MWCHMKEVSKFPEITSFPVIESSTPQFKFLSVSPSQIRHHLQEAGGDCMFVELERGERGEGGRREREREREKTRVTHIS